MGPPGTSRRRRAAGPQQWPLLRRLLYSDPALRLLAHMILAVAVRK
jgi:hypothetical protein